MRAQLSHVLTSHRGSSSSSSSRRAAAASFLRSSIRVSACDFSLLHIQSASSGRVQRATRDNVTRSARSIASARHRLFQPDDTSTHPSAPQHSSVRRHTRPPHSLPSVAAAPVISIPIRPAAASRISPCVTPPAASTTLLSTSLPCNAALCLNPRPSRFLVI